MKKGWGKWAAALAVLLCVAFAALFFANRIQTAEGEIRITEGYLPSEVGDLFYKLYTPSGLKDGGKAPGILLLHGYQNDHETNAAYAIELAKRGAVVLSIDEYGHGASVPGLKERGYVNHMVKVNYGLDSEADKTFRPVGGSMRYRLLMNFSNLSFFNDHYTKDEAGNSVKDSSCGGVAAYRFLSELPNVDKTKLGISGHSMGTWAGWSVAAAYSGTDIEPKATVLQCGELFMDNAYDSESIHFNNVLLLQAKWDEFSYFRDYKRNVDDAILRSPLRTAFLGTTAENAAWDKTFGDFVETASVPLFIVIVPAVWMPCPAWCEREPTETSRPNTTVGASSGSPGVPIVTEPPFTLNVRKPRRVPSPFATTPASAL